MDQEDVRAEWRYVAISCSVNVFLLALDLWEWKILRNIRFRGKTLRGRDERKKRDKALWVGHGQGATLTLSSSLDGIVATSENTALEE